MNKREILLNTSLALFYKNGIHAVGINEILAQSGVAKKPYIIILTVKTL